MGACGEDKKERKTQNNPTTEDGKINQDNEIVPIDDETQGKLKSTPKPKKNYLIKLINEGNNQEIEETIEEDWTLNQILLNFKLREQIDFTIEFENNSNINNEKKDEKFNNIVNEIFKKEIPEIINMKFSYKGLDIAENAIQAYIDNNKIIGSAIMDNSETFGIITYDSDNNSLTPYYYQRSEYPELSNFNLFTAYCNAKNCLYLSGGEKEQPYELEENSSIYGDFICIDLSGMNKDKLVINQLDKLIEPRTWHSMIFVPNKYIFIVGGSNKKSVELYDIEEKKLTKDSDLNEIRCECTLCLVNNMYLYAFCGFVLHNDYSNTIERCNLFKAKREWENVDYIDKSATKLKPSFFAISYFKNNELLLIGGNDSGGDERNDYLYKIGIDENEKDQIEDYKFDIKEKINIFKEKPFIPVENNKLVNIPLVIGGEIKVIIFDRENEEVITRDYEQ